MPLLPNVDENGNILVLKQYTSENAERKLKLKAIIEKIKEKRIEEDIKKADSFNFSHE